MDNWKIILSSANAFDIYPAKNYLESEGIETLLQNELAAQMYSGAADKIKLLVKEKDVAEGTRILIHGGI